MPAVVETQLARGVKARRLPPDEWGRLREFGPFQHAGVLPDPAHAIVVVLEDTDGEIVGSWMAKDTVLLEALYLNMNFRHHAPAAKALLMGMIKELQEGGVSEAITVIQDAAVARLAPKAGFTPVPGGGTLYLLSLGRGI